jgi:methyl-accepting chemotaxis protein
MTGVLKPGVRVLERFSFARKFQLLFVLFVLPLGYALWLISTDQLSRLSLIDRELEGMRGVQALGDVQQELLEQQTLIARWKGTDGQAEALLQQRATGLDEALERAETVLGSSPSSPMAVEKFAALQALRPELSVASVGKLALPDAVQRYQKTLMQLAVLREQLAADSGLTLDSHLDTSLLIENLSVTLPLMLERLGSFVANGYGAVFSQRFTLQSRLKIGELRRGLEESLSQLIKAQSTLAQESPQVMALLQARFSEARQGLEQALVEIDRDMFEASPMTLSPEQLIQRTEALGGKLRALQQALYQQFALSLGDYRHNRVLDMTEVIGAFAVLTLLALYVLLCLNASISRSTAGIIAAAQGLRDGDLRVRMQVHGEDDLAAIASALNTAVEQLRGSMLGVNRESQQLDGTVRTLSVQASEALNEVEQQQAQMSQIATAATQMAATAQSVAQSCEQAAVEAG